jgi:hypothetical protein
MTRSQLIDALWRPDLPGGTTVWAILDGARDRKIYSALVASAQEQCCLYRGELPWQLALAAPYLVQLDREDKLTDQILDQWGRSWGIFLHTTTYMEKLQKHFRRFLTVKDERGKNLLFRYYDPRVLRAYLPTCWPDELRTVFGPVDRFICESDDGREMLEFTFNGRQLVTKPRGAVAVA